MKKKPLTKKKIHSLLLESLFNPNEKTPFSLVIQMNSPDYCELKATELIAEARNGLTRLGSTPEYHNKMEQAIALLALARAQRGTVQS